MMSSEVTLIEQSPFVETSMIFFTLSQPLQSHQVYRRRHAPHRRRYIGNPISKGPSLKKIEVGPPAAKRHVGKQKPQVVDDSQAGSSRKKVVVSYPKLDEEDELDKRARELGLVKIDSDEPQVIEPKPSAPARKRGKQDSESQIEKLGSDALEPRRVSIPLPGSEVQAMTPAYRKMLRKLEDSVELYKLHIKHYHMSPTQFQTKDFHVGAS